MKMCKGIEREAAFCLNVDIIWSNMSVPKLRSKERVRAKGWHEKERAVGVISDAFTCLESWFWELEEREAAARAFCCDFKGPCEPLSSTPSPVQSSSVKCEMIFPISAHTLSAHAWISISKLLWLEVPDFLFVPSSICRSFMCCCLGGFDQGIKCWMNSIIYKTRCGTGTASPVPVPGMDMTSVHL